MKTKQELARRFPTLRRLCDYINSLPDPELVVDLTDLPTYGGPDVADPDGVFSWDARDWLVQGTQGFEVEPRGDLEASS